MAPPHKRRRLSGSALTATPSRTTFFTPDPTPSFAHSVEHIAPNPSPSSPPRPIKHHIQEIHLQIQERAVVSPNEYYHHYPRRQDGFVTLESTITTVDAAGNTILSLVTNTLPTVTTPATTATDTTTDGVAGSGTGTTSTSTSTNANSSSTISTGTGLNSSAPGTFTGHNNGTATTHSTQRTSKDKSIYMATLTNGAKKTLTRSNKPYVTTFGDGEKLTVCDRQGDCRMSTTQSNEQSSLSQSIALASTTPPTTTSTAYAGVPAAPSSSASSTANSANNNHSTPPAGTIAGGVVGGAAGIAVVLLIALMFFKWYKRRQQQGHQALPPVSSPSDDRTFSRSGPGMAERAGLRPLVSAVPALFRHSNTSRSDATPLPQERGFTRVSGRKLPSQFSAGMDSSRAIVGHGGDTDGGLRSPPPTMPLAAASTAPERSLSNTSFYRDSNGFYGGTGTSAHPSSPSPADLRAESSPTNSFERGSPSPEGQGPVEIALSPGPRRTPTVHQGGPYLMSPSSSVPATPTVPARYAQEAYGVPVTSETTNPFGEERESRFMEEV